MRKIAAALAALGLLCGLAVSSAGPARAEDPDPPLFTVPQRGLDFYEVSPEKAMVFSSADPQTVTVKAYLDDLVPAPGVDAEISFVKALVYDSSVCPTVPKYEYWQRHMTSQTLYDHAQCGVLGETEVVNRVSYDLWSDVRAVSFDVAVPNEVASGAQPSYLRYFFEGPLRVVVIHKVTVDGVDTYVYDQPDARPLDTETHYWYLSGTRITSFNRPSTVLYGEPVTFTGTLEAFYKNWEPVRGKASPVPGDLRAILTFKPDSGAPDYSSQATFVRSDGKFTLTAPSVTRSGVWTVAFDHDDDGCFGVRRCADLTMSKTSQHVTVAAAQKFTATPTPTISGTARVGSTLTVSTGTWSPAASFTYQWKRNGVDIGGATKKTYVLTATDRGKNVSVSVVGSKSGYTSVTKISSARTIDYGILTAAKPAISGTAAKGKTLTVKPGTWSPTGVALTYQWCRGSSKISGATKSTYKLVSADKGKRIKVVVTGSKSGYATASSTSAQTAKVK